MRTILQEIYIYRYVIKLKEFNDNMLESVPQQFLSNIVVSCIFFFFVSNTLLPFFVRYIVLDSYKKTKRETIYIDIYHSFVTKNNLSATYIIMPLDSSLTAAVNKGQLKL